MKVVCDICGEKSSPHTGANIENGYMCSNCVNKFTAFLPTLSEDIADNHEEFYSTHNIEYFKRIFSDCYSPKYNIIFNFKSKKIYFMDALFKKNYKLVNFEDILDYKTQFYEDTSGGKVRHMYIYYNYNGETVQYHTEDSMEKNNEFNKIVSCLKQIPHLKQSNSIENMQNQNNYTPLQCPRCGNTNCMPIVETNTHGKDFSAGKGCCGYVLLGPFGILCGACGGGKQTNSTTYWMCSNCGNKFQK